MSRRRSVYKLPKLKLKQRTVITVASLISFIMAALSAVALATRSGSLDFWRKLLFDFFGWTSFVSPVVFFVVGLVLQKVRWSFGQTNVLLGLILIFLSLSSLTAPVKPVQAGLVGLNV